MELSLSDMYVPILPLDQFEQKSASTGLVDGVVNRGCYCTYIYIYIYLQ